MQDAIKISLPISGAEVTMKGFITTGESRELQRILLSKGEFDTTNPQNAMKNLSPEAVFDMQDKGAEMLITEIKSADGTTSVFSKEWLYALPMQDGNLVYEQINNLIGSTANLPDESKKK